MNRKILSLAVALLALLSLGLAGVFTGFVNYGSFSVGIKQLELGKIIGLDHKPTVKEYDALNITAVFRNVGSVSFSERMTITIEDINLTTVLNTFQDSTFTLLPGEERAFKVVHYPTLTGFYWAHLNVSYDGKRDQLFSLFFVEQLYAPVSEAPVPGLPAPGTPKPPRIEVGTPAMNVNYPQEILLSQGQSSLLFVILENAGDVSLNNIKFLGTSEGFPFLAEPKIITKLSEGRAAIFSVSLSIPVSLESGDYFLDFSIVSDEMIKNGRIKIRVEELSIRDQVWQTILNYRFLIQKLRGEAEKAAGEGKDVSAVKESIRDASRLLKKAEQLFFQGKYFESRDQLFVVKNKIIEVVRLLALLGVPVFMVTLPGLIPVMLLVIVAAVVSFYAVLVFRKRRLKEASVE
jgi:hypothetical protein